MAPMSWLGSSAALAILSFDVDAESAILAEGRQYAGHPSAMSHQRYGPLVGVPRILGLLEELDVPATFFVPGWTAERYPETVERILAAGHEVGHHGHGHRSPLRMDEAEERRDIEAGLAALDRFGDPARGLPHAELGAEPAHVRPPRRVRLRLRLVAHGRRQAVRAGDGERGRSSSSPPTGASTTGTSTCTSPIRGPARARCTRRRGRSASGRRSSTACAATAACSA